MNWSREKQSPKETLSGNGHQPSVALMLLALTPFSLGYLFSYLYRAANAVIAGDLVRELGLSASELGLLTAAYLGAFAAFQLPLGVLLDRYGPRRVQATLVALGALGALLFSVASSVITLTLARAMIGVAFSGGLMSGFKAVVIWVPEPRRALANACIMSLGGLGLLIAATPLELATQAYGWRGVFMALAGVTFVVAVLIAFLVPERSTAALSERLSVQIKEVFSIYTDRVFLALAPLLSTTAGKHISIQTLCAGPWLRDISGLDRMRVANSLLVMAAMFVVSILLSGVVADRLARRGVSLLTVMLGFLTLFFGAQVGLLLNPGDRWIALGLWSLFGMTGHVAVLAYPWLARHFGASFSGRSNTAANLLMFLWAFLAQYGIGAIINLFLPRATGSYEPGSYQAAFGVFFGVQVVALVWYLANLRLLRRVEAGWGG